MKLTDKDIYQFVVESNSIERIYREPFEHELSELRSFIASPKMTIERVEQFVERYEPEAKLRDQYGMNVRVGKYYPPLGGPEIRRRLNSLLNSNMDHHDMHIEYEKLHPFMDCNGRSGRAIWAWRRQDIEGGFLINFYFDQLKRK